MSAREVRQYGPRDLALHRGGTTVFGNGFRRAGGTTSGRLFRLVNRAEPVWGDGMTEKAVWHIVKEFAAKVRIDKLTSQGLRP